MLDSLITKIAKTVDGEDADGKDYSAIITDVCKTFIALITERKNGCVKDNDLIYHDVVKFMKLQFSVDFVFLGS